MSPYPIRLLRGLIISLLGVGWHMAALAIADRTATVFPSIPDLLIDRLPVVNLFVVGEIYFGGIVLALTIIHIRQQAQSLPRLFTLIGMFYAVRGLFLLFLPIGSPFGAIAVDDRFALWPYADHAYFPGGHVGILLLLSLSVREQRWRRLFIIGAIVFGLGTMLTKAHYTADFLGGILLGYAVYAWGQRNIQVLPERKKPQQEPRLEGATDYGANPSGANGR